MRLNLQSVLSAFDILDKFFHTGDIFYVLGCESNESDSFPMHEKG